MEKQIISALFFSREAYDLASKYIDGDDFGDQGRVIYKKIVDFYEKDKDCEKINREIILSQLEREHPKHFEMFRRIVESLEPVSIPNLMEEVIGLKKEAVGQRLASALLEGNHAKVKDLIEQYLAYESGDLVEEEETQIFTGTSVSALLQQSYSDGLIRLYPLSFNAHLDGGVPRQTHVVLYAQPEVGKSLVSVNAAYGGCKDGHKVVYIGNEDPAPSMMMRFITRFSGMNKMEVLKNPDEAQVRAEDNGYENLVFVSLPAGTVRDVDKYMRQYKPDMLFVDQIRHLTFSGISGEVEQLTRSGKAMRAMGKKYNSVVFSITQAADSANNKLVLDQGDVYMSNTSIPGDADILLGIGANEAYKAQNRRMFSPCKNKINGNHAPFPVLVDPSLSKVISI